MNTIGSKKTFGFLLIPGYSLVALSCAIDVLRAANVESGTNLFGWNLLWDPQDKAFSSSGIPLPAQNLKDAHRCDVIAICGGERSHVYANASVIKWLKQAARDGKAIGSISDGAYVAAQAGLFNECRSTIHWKCLSAYRERFPALKVGTSILELHDNRFSCAGGTASIDLMLHFVSKFVEPEIISLIANNYFHDVIRGRDSEQHMTNAFHFAGRNSKFSNALLLMEKNLEEPLSIAQLAEDLRTSPRQLDRLFRRFANASPSTHYRDMRLTRASGLLKQSHLSVGEIAVGCGFHSASHLSKFFKQKFGETPGQHRHLH